MSHFKQLITSQPFRHRGKQDGVVLVIAMIMLIVISLLAVVSIRNASTAESVSGNVRTTLLATQSAEIALRYCEQAVEQIASGTGTLLATPTILAYASPPQWKNTSNWDAVAPTLTFVIPTTAVNSGTATFRRAPECMVERMPVQSAGALSTTSTYVITARGFGPEVAAGTGRPNGSEVWMQSTLELQ
jgi:type IV pilus assembly protein PilX